METCPCPQRAQCSSAVVSSGFRGGGGLHSPTHSEPAAPPAPVGDRQETNGRSDCFLGCSLSASAAEESRRRHRYSVPCSHTQLPICPHMKHAVQDTHMFTHNPRMCIQTCTHSHTQCTHSLVPSHMSQLMYVLTCILPHVITPHPCSLYSHTCRFTPTYVFYPR